MNRPGTTAARRLLACGAASGPVFLGSLLAQAVWRPGFELGEHAISLLSRGEHGWTQITAFVLSGALVLAGALGVRGTLPRLVGTWTGVLLGLVGTGMVVMGVFVVDPGVGFPPDGEPPATSWSVIGVVHNLGTAVAVNAAVVAALVLGWHGARTGAWAAALVCLTVAATVGACAWQTGPGVPVRMSVVAVVLGLFLTGVFLVLRRRCTVAPAAPNDSPGA
ncbi:DUF998 domain-containing protein [Georgenia deserti]|uniref:DUF998 domain-containing protein n=1 Tax=Georgenia deserti TaxID=2093781 RepID=A0ABW4L624_9MICO